MEPQQNLENAQCLKLLNKPSFHFLTLFPEVLNPFLSTSILGKAEKNGLVSYSTLQIRDFAKDKHHRVDDSPFGGGEGMVLKADVLYDAWKSIPKNNLPNNRSLTILLSPQGQVFNQSLAKELSKYTQLILICGHYEGVDERLIEKCVDVEISIGDYILTGGEIPALIIADAVTRLYCGVIGNELSVTQDSFENDLLKYPQYTRPREFEGLPVPEVLLSGDHEKIKKWRTEQMLTRTQKKRPDLLLKNTFSNLKK